jgi:hypothetical protein
MGKWDKREKDRDASPKVYEPQGVVSQEEDKLFRKVREHDTEDINKYDYKLVGVGENERARTGSAFYIYADEMRKHLRVKKKSTKPKRKTTKKCKCKK